MKLRITTYLLVTTFLIGSITPSFSQSPEQLFQKGLIKEEGEGALDEAIYTYNKIVENHEADKSLRAKALLHVGLCYEKLGRNEAAKAYQRLVNNFPGQKNEVALARERLSMLIPITEKVVKTSVTPKFTKIKIPTKLRGSIKLSPDGKDLALVSDKKLWKMPLSGNLGPDFPGTPVQLNTEGIEVEWSGLAWSGDGNWIAFNEIPLKEKPEKENWNQSIFIIPAKGGKPKKIIENFRDVRIVNYRISLSPDGNKLAFSSVKDNEQHIHTISVKGGKSKQLIDMQAREPVFSPDGKMIAYIEDKDLGKYEGEQGLWIIPAQGGTPHLIADAGKASSPVWSPDGKMIAFLDYTRDKEIIIIPVSKSGKADGKLTVINIPEGIKGARLLAGWTPDNKIGVKSTSKEEFALYTLPAEGGQAAIILNDCYALQPRWSPDGKEIFYTTLPAEGSNKFWRMTFASVSSSGGSGKYLPLDPEKKRLKPFGYQGGNRISPDGKTIISAAWCTDDTLTNINYPGSHIWKISIDGTEQTKLTAIDGPYVDQSPSWSPDGKEVAFVRKELNEPPRDMIGESSIYTVSSSGGSPKLLITESEKWLQSPVWSPDGKMIAYLTQEKDVPVTKALNVINVNTGKFREVGEVPAVHINIELAWSNDSKRIAFNDKDGKVIKIMSLNDGSIEDVKTGLLNVNICHLDWSPNGKRFVFGGVKGGDPEFWFLENFLPLEMLQSKNKVAEVTPKTMTLQKVWSGPASIGSGAPSPDGRFLTYTDPETDNLAMRELSTGKTLLLTNKATWEDPMQFNTGSTVSPNSNQVAYAWYKNNFEIRIINVDDPQPKVLYGNKDEDVYPCAWSPDGKIIYAKSYLNNTGQCRILAITVASGDIQVLKTFSFFYWLQLSVSPDNQFIVYDFPNVKNGKISDTDIHLISTDGINEISVEHPANDNILGWFPDKNQILFKSDRSGTSDAWTVSILNGKVAGEPRRVLTEVGGNASQMGFTDNGTFYYSLISRKFNAFTAPFNQIKGELKIELGKPFLGSIRHAEWSPDGKSLAFIKELWGLSRRPLLIMDLETGKERKLSDWLSVWHLRWSPDGKTLLVSGYDERRELEKDYKGGIYTIEVELGKVTELLAFSNTKENDGEISLLWARTEAEWFDNQKSIYYFKNNQLINRDLATGQEKILLQNQKINKILDLSPDEKNLLFCTENQIYIIPTIGGKLISVVEVNTTTGGGPTVHNNAVWSPDENYIFYTENMGTDGSVLRRINVEGKNSKEVWRSKVPISSLSIHPDGHKIVITTLNQETEIWQVENLLSNEETINK